MSLVVQTPPEKVPNTPQSSYPSPTSEGTGSIGRVTWLLYECYGASSTERGSRFSKDGTAKGSRPARKAVNAHLYGSFEMPSALGV